MYCVLAVPEDMKLLAILDVERPACEDEDVVPIELLEPRRDIDVDDVPPKPEKPSFDGRDSSGKRRPVLVIFESHMRWYRASFGPDGVVCTSLSIATERLGPPRLAAFAAVSCKLSPWNRGHDNALETDLAI